MTPNNIYTLKLSNGDEIITRLLEIREDIFVIESPLAVVPTNQGIQLVPALFTVRIEDKIELSRKHIMMYAPARQEVKDSFIEATTGIRPVTNKILMG